MCSPPHSQVMEIRAKRYKTKGISANHKHRVSAALGKKTFFKELLTQNIVLLCVANLGACSPVVGPALVGGSPRAFMTPRGIRRPAEGCLGGMRGRMSTAQLNKPSGGKSTHEVKKYAELWKRIEELLASSRNFERNLISKN